jgi:hypothetical protein
MPLLMYAEVKPFSSLICDRVVKRIMPPWFAVGRHPHRPRS